MTNPVDNGDTNSAKEMEPTLMSDLLSFPSSNAQTNAGNSDSTLQASGSSSRQLLKDRLFIGNLHPGVDEYTLLQVFSKYGKVTKLDFLFHKAGALKGKPRGYAFIEYGSSDEAQKALTSAHDKLLHGRKLIVTYAHQAPPDLDGGASRQRKTMMETGRPTTLSMLKTGMGGKHKEGTSNKIALMEAKLRQMEATNPKPQSRSGSNTPTLPTSTSTLPTHPSLPLKPPPTVPGLQPPQHRPSPASNSHMLLQKSSTSLVRSSSTATASAPYVSSSSSTRPTTLQSMEPPSKKPRLMPSGTTASTGAATPDIGAKRKGKGKELLGVKIVKSARKKDPSLPAVPTSANTPEAADAGQDGETGGTRKTGEAMPEAVEQDAAAGIPEEEHQASVPTITEECNTEVLDVKEGE